MDEINKKYADILSAKAFLNDTDYMIIKSYETGKEVDSIILQKRSDARNNINLLEAEIAVLEVEINNMN